MNTVSQGSDSRSASQFLTIAVAAGLVMLAGLMVLLNVGDSGLSMWTIPFALLGTGFLAAWRASPIVSLGGLMLVTLVWALLDLPGSLGVMMIAPLSWLWVDRARPTQRCLLASALAAMVALLESAISVTNNSGTAIDLVGNIAMVILVASLGAGWRRISNDLDRPESVSAPTRSDDSPEIGPEPAWLGQLSRREREVLAQLVDGASNNEIAQNLHIGLSTVKTHVSSILRKADAQSRYAVALELRPGPTTDLKAGPATDLH